MTQADLRLVPLLASLVLVPACGADHSGDGTDAATIDANAIDAGTTLDAPTIDAASPSDSGAFECDAPPIAYCRFSFPLGGPGCCGLQAEPLCAPGGGFACRAGTQTLDSCSGCAATAACTGPSDCELAPVSCCGHCGEPTSGDLIAVRHDQVAAERASACPTGSACPDCAAMADPYLVATCAAGNCVARDLHTDPLTACVTNADCTLVPAACCGCGLLGPGDVVAVNPDAGSYPALVCDPGADCPPCVPTFDGVMAQCDAGRCTVVPSA